MKIYLRIHKDLGQYVAHLWSKHIKEQIIETVNAMCDYSEGYIGYGDYFPTFWQEDIHARCINVGRLSSRKGRHRVLRLLCRRHCGQCHPHMFFLPYL